MVNDTKQKSSFKKSIYPEKNIYDFSKLDFFGGLFSGKRRPLHISLISVL